jgi:presenilin 1
VCARANDSFLFLLPSHDSYVLIHLNIGFDYVTFGFLVWNFGVVGIASVFWHGHIHINHGYLILISGLLVTKKNHRLSHRYQSCSLTYTFVFLYVFLKAIFFTRLPEWATFAVLAIVAVYGKCERV